MVALTQKVLVNVEAKVIQVCVKACDSGYYTLLDQEKKSIHEVDGYVPTWFPGDNFGDYLYFDIDIETGQILNWKVPSAVEIERWIDENPSRVR